MNEKYTKEDVLKFLQSNYLMNIATVGNDKKPSSSIMLYTIDDNFNIYMATHADSYKAKKIIENNFIGISVWEENKMLVQIDAEVEILKDEQLIIENLELLAKSATKNKAFWPSLFRVEGKEYIVFKVVPYWIRALDLERNTITQETSPFSTIIEFK